VLVLQNLGQHPVAIERVETQDCARAVISLLVGSHAAGDLAAINKPKRTLGRPPDTDKTKQQK
jgi:hypothetical protein